MSLRRPAKDQPESFEFNTSSLNAANEDELNSKFSGCSFAGLFKLIYQPPQKLYLANLKQLEHQLTYVP